MRIIAGTLKGRRLDGPTGPGLRPTSDGLRETLFNVIGDAVTGARVLDAYAGTGAVGLEALSRGAARVAFVDRNPGAIRVIRGNVERCGAADACAIIRGDFTSLGSQAGALGPFDLLFLDPPYETSDFGPMLASAADLASPAAEGVLEHSRRRESPASAAGWRRTRVVTAGDSALSWYVRETA